MYIPKILRKPSLRAHPSEPKAVHSALTNLSPLSTHYYKESTALGSIVTPPSRMVKNGSVVSHLRVLTKLGGDEEKTAGVYSEIR